MGCSSSSPSLEAVLRCHHACTPTCCSSSACPCFLPLPSTGTAPKGAPSKPPTTKLWWHGGRQRRGASIPALSYSARERQQRNLPKKMLFQFSSEE